jgi:hypothetical protein
VFNSLVTNGGIKLQPPALGPDCRALQRKKNEEASVCRAGGTGLGKQAFLGVSFGKEPRRLWLMNKRLVTCWVSRREGGEGELYYEV